MKYKLKKQYRILLVCILAVTLLSTGSLAWRNTSQHKTNKFETLQFAQNTVLVEKFNPTSDWKLNESVTKEIFVRNGQDSDITEEYAFVDSYVRVQLREFLGIRKHEIKKTDFRLLTDNKDNFIKYENQSQAEKKAEELKLSNPKDRVVKLKGYEDDKEYYYVKVSIDDQLANNGKYLVTAIESSGLESLETNSIVEDMDENMIENHNAFNPSSVNVEDSNVFSTHMWEHGKESLTPDSNIFKEFVSWDLGEDVISLESWINDFEKKPVKKWIADTSIDGEGWVYWGMPLKHSKSETPESKTSALLKSIKLLKEAEGTIDYRIHANMDAVSIGDLSYWGNAPQEILDMFKVY